MIRQRIQLYSERRNSLSTAYSTRILNDATAYRRHRGSLMNDKPCHQIRDKEVAGVHVVAYGSTSADTRSGNKSD